MSGRLKLVGTLLIVLVLALLVVVGVASASGTFTDDDGNIHEASIEAIAAEGITKGCNPPSNTLYCPDSSVTRGQMAAFLRRAFDLPSSTRDFFGDDDGSVFESDINAVAAAGISRGCNPPVNDRYCPDSGVTRGQMAAFLRRAFGYPSATIDFFSDDTGSVFEDDVNAIAAVGVTKGCNPPVNDRYCPDALVRRDQMASFLARALGLPRTGTDPTTTTSTTSTSTTSTSTTTTTTTTVPGTGATIHVGLGLLPGTTDSLLVDVGGAYVVDAMVLDHGGSVTVAAGPSGTDLHVEVSAPLSAVPGSSESLIEATSCDEATNPCPVGSQHEVIVSVDVAIGVPGVDVPDEILVPSDERWVVDADGVGSVPAERVLLAADGVTRAAIVSLVEGAGGVVVGHDDLLAMFQLRFLSETAAAAAEAILEASPLVETVDAYAAQPSLTDQIPSDWSDDGPDAKWTFNVTGTAGAWDRERGSSSVHVGVTDLGIYTLHEDLHGNTSPGSYTAATGTAIANWSALDDDGRPENHGTHVAGTICAEQNNQGLVGVMWDCTLEALDLQETPGDAAIVVAKIREWLGDPTPPGIQPPIPIVNMSWTFGAHSSNYCAWRPTEGQSGALEGLLTSYPEVLFVVAAGNCARSDLSGNTPANHGPDLPNVVTVASHDRDGGLSSFSNRGAEVAAPGGYYHDDANDQLDQKVWSTTHECPPTGCVSTYGEKAGTSMAAPFISGVAGLMLSHRPDLTANQLAACITGSGSPFAVPEEAGLTAIAVESALDCAEGTVSAESGSLSGTVTETGTGTPLEGIMVEVLPSGGGSIIASTETITDGRYAVPGLDPGSYDVRITDPEGLHAAINLTGVVIEPRTSATLNIQLAVAPPFSTCENETSLPTVECDALVALYNATNGSSWTDSSGWLTSPSPCDWYGVTCALGQVTYLNLEDNLLTGTIPSELGSLAELRSLDLSMNQLSGAMPSQLGDLSKLGILRLYDNQLSGSIPPEFGNLSNLTWLYLRNNQLSGTIPPELGNLSELDFLYLGSNQLSGSIPPELGDLNYLFALGLGDNQLSGTIPDHLGDPVGVRWVFMQNNMLHGNVPFLLGTGGYDPILGLRVELHGQTGCLYTNSVSWAEFLDDLDPDWNDGCTVP